MATFNGDTIYSDSQYGLSKFQLSTYIETETSNGTTNDQVSIIGLLSELPELSFTVNYIDGPGTTMQGILMDFFKSDLISTVNALGASDDQFKNLVRVGDWTRQVYDGYSMQDIPLKFRVYTNERYGQTPPKDIIRLLSSFATLSSNNNINIDSLKTNILNALTNANSNGQIVGNLSQCFFSKKNIGSNDDFLDPDEQSVILVNSAQIAEELTTIFNTASTKQFNQASTPGQYQISLKTNDDGAHYIKVDVTDFGEELTYETDVIGRSTAKNADGKITKGDKNDFLASKDATEIIGKLEAILKKVGSDQNKNDYAKDALNNIIQYAEPKIKEAFDKIEHHKESKSDVLTFIDKTGEHVGNVMVGRYGKYRPYSHFNRVNSLGMKLWTLTLYEDVFFSKNDPLIVYVKEWEYEVSKESENGIPVYYDFTITCTLDQVYSRTQWYRILSDALKQGMTKTLSKETLLGISSSENIQL